MTTTTSSSTALSDRAVSYLRTLVPVLWGSIVAQVLAALSPHLPADVGQHLADWLGGEAAIALVTAAAIAAWYWAWRRVEPRIPDWLTRLVLGSARTPGYALTPAPTTNDGAHLVTSLTDADRTELASLRDALDEGDPSRTALEKIL